MEIEFAVKLDVSEQYIELLDRMEIGGSLGHFRNIAFRSLTSVRDEFPDIIAAVFVDGVDNSGEGGNAPRPPVRREFGDRGAVVASEPRADRSGGMAPKRAPGIRTGRPATLHDYEASDGEPVRAAGPRSAEVLRTQGIAVRKRTVGADWPAWYLRKLEVEEEATRVVAPKPQRSKNDRPPVITKRRGQ
jgi:hypothetical protein